MRHHCKVQEQQWKLGKVISYDKTRNCYTIEYNGGFKEIDLVVVKHKEEDGTRFAQPSLLVALPGVLLNTVPRYRLRKGLILSQGWSKLQNRTCCATIRGTTRRR